MWASQTSACMVEIIFLDAKYMVFHTYIVSNIWDTAQMIRDCLNFMKCWLSKIISNSMNLKVCIPLYIYQYMCIGTLLFYVRCGSEDSARTSWPCDQSSVPVQWEHSLRAAAPVVRRGRLLCHAVGHLHWFQTSYVYCSWRGNYSIIVSSKQL